MDVLTEELQEIVKHAGLAGDVKACAYRVFEAEADQAIIDMVLVLNAVEWDDTAVEICERASEKLADAARGTGRSLGFFCRTTTEHQEFAEHETGMWTLVDVGVAC